MHRADAEPSSTTHGTIAAPVVTRAALDATPRPGPLLVDEYDATTLVPPGCAARLDAHGNIVITTGVTTTGDPA